jgi:ABC-type sugar transport system permease subunit
MKHRKRALSASDKWFIAITVLPALAHFGFFTFLPVLFSLALSFTHWTILGSPEFVGIANYIELYRDPHFLRSLINTIVFAIIYVPLMLGLPLMMALLVNRESRVARFFRGVYFLPVVTSFVVFAIIFKWIFQADSDSMANLIMRGLGLRSRAWLQDPQLALPLLAVLGVLKGAAWNMVYFLAGLQAIPDVLLEAARVDGAGRFSSFRRITLPLLKPTMFFVCVLTTIGAFQVFDSAYLLTRGGPAYATTTIVYYVYTQGFESFRMGYASASAYVLLLLVLAITFIQKRYLGDASDWY